MYVRMEEGGLHAQVVSGGSSSSSSSRVRGVGGAKCCGRWNPTAEQVKVLTDLFRAGLRTPSAEQIQRISSHLSSFGKIESKNVFYWFQNHKARERHHKKQRRRPGGGGGGGDGGGGDHHHHLLCMPTTPTTPSNREDDQALLYNSVMGSDEQRQSVWERQNRQVIETLELFPLKSYNYAFETEVVTTGMEMERKQFPSLNNGSDPLLDLSLS